MRRSRPPRRSALVLSAAAVLALCLGGAAGSQAATAFAGAKLSVDTLDFGGQTFLSADVELQSDFGAEAPGLAARIDLATPAGYGVDVSAAPGATIGQLIGALITADGSDSSLAQGSIVVDDPATWAADPVAQTCAPGPHAALWRATPTVLGQTVGVPIAVDAVSGATSAETTYVLRICPTRAPSSAFPKGLALVSMNLLFANVISAPSTPGIYRWSALITPAAAGSLAPQDSSAFEVRAVQRRPNVLTVHAKFEPKTHTAAITGKVEAGGAPWVGAEVSFLVDNGAAAPTSLGSVPTSADGSFFLRIPAFRSETIFASVSAGSHSCTAPSTAPGGCLSETDSAPPGVSATVVVPRDTDPLLAPRARDQALAQTSVLMAGDLPGGQDVASAPLPCAGFAPNLHRLTATGTASSDVILTGDQRAAAFASASVLRTTDEARADIGGVAQLAALRCEVKDLTADESGDKVLGVGPLRIPRVGDASRAFRGQISDPTDGRLTIDLVFVRVGRVVITLHVYSISPNLPLDLLVARTLATRAAHRS